MRGDELDTTVDPGCTLALTGDLIHSRTLAATVAGDPAFAAVVHRLQAADASFGNLEVAVAERDDPEAWVWWAPEDWSLGAEPAAIADLRTLGFDLVGRANNHAMDRGPAGMRTTGRALDAAQIVHAGAGEDLARARAPRFVETSRGRVGLVSVTTSPVPADVAPAMDAFAGLAPRPGVHSLGLSAIVTVPSAVHAALQTLHDTMTDAMGAWMAGQEGLHLFRTRFEIGDAVSVRYEPDRGDLAGVVRAVRQAKQQGDAAVLAVHAHQGDHDPAQPMPYLRDLAHAAINAGADVVAISGPHVLAPIEFHAQRPIFYGLGNFIWSDVGGPVPAYFWNKTRAVLSDSAADPASMTEADLLATLNADAFDDPWIFRAVLAEVSFGDTVPDVRLHPVDLGPELPVSRRGVPRVAEPGVAREILERAAELSRPFGVTVAPNEAGVGVVKRAG
jgi:poly-gamma-glutamate capsule biosynthesis protein CapA/YwtB (metallophosphatase superfamily)